jgi:3-hydroxyisobutyrate dehydrogenase-like beta-hydroxyacid dehydrogenase
MGISKIGIIGYGEAGTAFAKPLSEKDSLSVSVFDIRFNDAKSSQLLKNMAIEQNISVADDIKSLVTDNDLILSVVTGDASMTVVEASLPYITEGKIYVDMNSVSAKTKINMGELIEKRGGAFIEGAILGAIASYGFKTPMLVCGKKAQEFATLFKQIGFDIKFLSKDIGKASNIKMLRSVFAKGVESLLIEMMVGAKRGDVLEPVMADIVAFMDKRSFQDIANAWITTTVFHAKRRAEEMEHVIETLNELRVRPVMTTATRERLKCISDLNLSDYFKGKKPTFYHEVIEAMENDNFA